MRRGLSSVVPQSYLSLQNLVIDEGTKFRHFLQKGGTGKDIFFNYFDNVKTENLKKSKSGEKMEIDIKMEGR